jgi:signal transduction histidine kinase
VVDDARSISRLTARMMATLKDAFGRLRPPELDEIGLDASLRNMVNGWNLRLGTRTAFALAVEGDLSGLSSDAAMSVYRIAQECLTNAARHGTPSRVTVRVTCSNQGGAVTLAVDDDGGGDPERVRGGAGFGILGIRERVDALGGTLAIGSSGVGGVRVAALIPAAAA